LVLYLVTFVMAPMALHLVILKKQPTTTTFD
jgi:hypothetical protein